MFKQCKVRREAGIKYGRYTGMNPWDWQKGTLDEL